MHTIFMLLYSIKLMPLQLQFTQSETTNNKQKAQNKIICSKSILTIVIDFIQNSVIVKSSR